LSPKVHLLLELNLFVLGLVAQTDRPFHERTGNVIDFRVCDWPKVLSQSHFQETHTHTQHIYTNTHTHTYGKT
jgi:hypothetical protein